MYTLIITSCVHKIKFELKKQMQFLFALEQIIVTRTTTTKKEFFEIQS